MGPEVVTAAREVLDAVMACSGHELYYSTDIVGGAAIDAYGEPLRKSTVEAAKRSDAVLFGAVGGPKWDSALVRPEAAILGLRRALGLFANIRPIRVLSGMEDASPLRTERVRGTDIVVLRELTGGLYFARPKRMWSTARGRRGVDTLRYTDREVERVVRVAFELARGRRRQVTSVDKANVLESSRLWRQVATEVAGDYPDVELRHALVDSCAMQLVANPTQFDVLVMENMFGDILSDEAAVLVASLGMLPSASLAGLPRASGRRRVSRGLYEPIHGTAPDIAGQGRANPIGAILSGAFMLRYSFGLEEEACRVEAAVEGALMAGLRTPDIASGGQSVSTSEMTAAVVRHLSTG